MGPHLHHQGLLMGTLDQGQDSVQLLSGHMIWKGQGMVSPPGPAEDKPQQAGRLPSLKPAPSLEPGGVRGHPLVPGLPLRDLKVL